MLYLNLSKILNHSLRQISNEPREVGHLASYIKKSASKFAAMMTKWRMLTVLVLGLLVCGVRAGFPCKPGQIHWKSNTTSGDKYKCLECPYCPEGLEPSVPCGSSVPYKTPVHCVLCQLGETHSDKYGKEQCKACTVCPAGKAVIKNCSLTTNTECDDKCAHGYYKVPFIFECHPCTDCCNDGKDEIAKECENSEKKCKLRSKHCKRESKPSITTEISTTLQTSHKEITSDSTQSSSKLKKHTMIRPTLSGNKTDQDDGNKTIITVSAVFAVIAVFGIIVLIGIKVFRWRKTRCNVQFHWNRNLSNDAVDSSQLKPLTSASQEQFHQDDVTLEQLESNYQGLFDWMCVKLDTGKRWFRWDFERLAAKFKDIPLEERNALKSELLRGESPSKLLMSKLQTVFPHISLRDLISELIQIGRYDIAQKLKADVKVHREALAEETNNGSEDVKAVNK